MSSDHQVGSSTPRVSESSTRHWVKSKPLADVAPGSCAVVHLEGHTLVIVRDGERIFAVDNRCPHMGFPLDRAAASATAFSLATGTTPGSTCRRAARSTSGPTTSGPFPSRFATETIWIDLTSPRPIHGNIISNGCRSGLERNIPLVLGKAVLSLLDGQPQHDRAVSLGLDFGTRYRRAGWGQGLTIHTCLQNLLPWLGPE